jgi:hypothetical protein
METNTCSYCHHTSEGILSYYAKVGGSDQVVPIVACQDSDACLERLEEKEGNKSCVNF